MNDPMDMIRKYGGSIEYRAGDDGLPLVIVWNDNGAWSVYAQYKRYGRRHVVCDGVTEEAAMQAALETLQE